MNLDYAADFTEGEADPAPLALAHILPGMLSPKFGVSELPFRDAVLPAKAYPVY